MPAPGPRSWRGPLAEPPRLHWHPRTRSIRDPTILRIRVSRGVVHARHADLHFALVKAIQTDFESREPFATAPSAVIAAEYCTRDGRAPRRARSLRQMGRHGRDRLAKESLPISIQHAQFDGRAQGIPRPDAARGSSPSACGAIRPHSTDHVGPAGGLRGKHLAPASPAGRKPTILPAFRPSRKNRARLLRSRLCHPASRQHFDQILALLPIGDGVPHALLRVRPTRQRVSSAIVILK